MVNNNHVAPFSYRQYAAMINFLRQDIDQKDSALFAISSLLNKRKNWSTKLFDRITVLVAQTCEGCDVEDEVNRVIDIYNRVALSLSRIQGKFETLSLVLDGLEENLRRLQEEVCKRASRQMGFGHNVVPIDLF